jgi:hypothetical protein
MVHDFGDFLDIKDEKVIVFWVIDDVDVVLLLRFI